MGLSTSLHPILWRRLAIRWRGLLWALGRRPTGESLPRLILEVLADGEDRYGLAIGAAVAARTGGALRAGQGRIYPALHALEVDALVVSYDGPPVLARGGRPRRYYHLTAAGRALLA